MDSAQLPASLPPPGKPPAQHACPGKASTQEEQFAKFIVQPWAAMTGKQDKEEDREKGEGVAAGNLSKDQFYKKLMEVISMEMSRFLGHNPLLVPLYTQRGIFLRISQPTCLGCCHAGRTCDSKFLSPGGLDISRSPTLIPPRVLPVLLRAIRPCYTQHRIYEVAHMLFPVCTGTGVLFVSFVSCLG